MTFTLENYNYQNNNTFDKCIGSEDTIIKSSLAADYVFLPTIYNRLIYQFNKLNESIRSLVTALQAVQTVYIKSENEIDTLNQFCVKPFSIYEKNNIYYPNTFEINTLFENITTLLAGDYELTSNIITHNEEKQIVNIDQIVKADIDYNNNISFNNVINTKLITYNNIKILLTHLATVLQHIKIFKWSLYFKTNKFTGNTYFHTCSNVYPELPYNNENNVENTFYSAALLSPSSKNKVVGFLPIDAINSKAEKATNVYSFAANLLASSQSEISLNDITEALIYTTDETSDIPTFDITSETGSNGKFEMYKKVTTNTYDLVSQVYDILTLFNIKQSSIITAKNITQAINYIFELWHLNIQVLQYDYYLCHYNCHLNSINDSSSSEDGNIEYATYTITYNYDNVVDATKLGSNVFSLAANRPTQYTFKYTNTFKDANATVYNPDYDPTIDNLKIKIPYVKYIGDNEARVCVSAYVKISGEKHNSGATLYEDIDKQYIVGNWSGADSIDAEQAPEEIELNIQYISAIYDGTDASDHRSLTGTYILSSPGNLTVYYKEANSDSRKRAINDNTIKFDEIADGEIYEDIVDTKISNFISMTNRNNKHFKTYYRPEPTVYYKKNNSHEYAPILDGVADSDNNEDISLSDIGLGFSYIKDDKVGMATISLTCDEDSEYYGVYSKTYRISNLPRVGLNDTSKVSVYLANIGDDSIYEDNINTFYAENCFIYVWEKGAPSAMANHEGISAIKINATDASATILPVSTDLSSKAAFNRMFDIGKPRPYGTVGYITLTPKVVASSTDAVGENYFYGAKELAFPIDTRKSIIDEDTGQWTDWCTFDCWLQSDAGKSKVNYEARYSGSGSNDFDSEGEYYRTYTALISIPNNAIACTVRYVVDRPKDAAQVVGYIGASYADDGTSLGGAIYSDRLSKGGSKHSHDSCDGQLKFEVNPKEHDVIRVTTCTLGPNDGKKRQVYLDVKIKQTNNHTSGLDLATLLEGYTITYKVKIDGGPFTDYYVETTASPAEEHGTVAHTLNYQPNYDETKQSWTGWKSNEDLTLAAPTEFSNHYTVYSAINTAYTITFKVKTGEGDFEIVNTATTAAPASYGASVNYTISFTPTYNSTTHNWSGWKTDSTLATAVGSPFSVNRNTTVWGAITPKS